MLKVFSDKFFYNLTGNMSDYTKYTPYNSKAKIDN